MVVGSAKSVKALVDITNCVRERVVERGISSRLSSSGIDEERR